ncbi:hypothetical protein NA57DRAFT_79704 [Rhizodiscina lignyota]|uniref:Uncharacterized protein n=1 Tax=Rhizodiscina lignyota TaxID=1504668 RepID=A0A9P4M215_9PEZI|nr:hypothetical protein NA57DRAFT_79704 [Rhizodiscina lignyota]
MSNKLPHKKSKQNLQDAGPPHQPDAPPVRERGNSNNLAPALLSSIYGARNFSTPTLTSRHRSSSATQRVGYTAPQHPSASLADISTAHTIPQHASTFPVNTSTDSTLPQKASKIPVPVSKAHTSAEHKSPENTSANSSRLKPPSSAVQKSPSSSKLPKSPSFWKLPQSKSTLSLNTPSEPVLQNTDPFALYGIGAASVSQLNMSDPPKPATPRHVDLSAISEAHKLASQENTPTTPKIITPSRVDLASRDGSQQVTPLPGSSQSSSRLNTPKTPRLVPRPARLNIPSSAQADQNPPASASSSHADEFSNQRTRREELDLAEFLNSSGPFLPNPPSPEELRRVKEANSPATTPKFPIMKKISNFFEKVSTPDPDATRSPVLEKSPAMLSPRPKVDTHKTIEGLQEMSISPRSSSLPKSTGERPSRLPVKRSESDKSGYFDERVSRIIEADDEGPDTSLISTKKQLEREKDTPNLGAKRKVEEQEGDKIHQGAAEKAQRLSAEISQTSLTSYDKLSQSEASGAATPKSESSFPPAISKSSFTSSNKPSQSEATGAATPKSESSFARSRAGTQSSASSKKTVRWALDVRGEDPFAPDASSTPPLPSPFDKSLAELEGRSGRQETSQATVTKFAAENTLAALYGPIATVSSSPRGETRDAALAALEGRDDSPTVPDLNDDALSDTGSIQSLTPSYSAGPAGSESANYKGKGKERVTPSVTGTAPRDELEDVGSISSVSPSFYKAYNDDDSLYDSPSPVKKRRGKERAQSPADVAQSSSQWNKTVGPARPASSVYSQEPTEVEKKPPTASPLRRRRDMPDLNIQIPEDDVKKYTAGQLGFESHQAASEYETFALTGLPSSALSLLAERRAADQGRTASQQDAAFPPRSSSLQSPDKYTIASASSAVYPPTPSTGKTVRSIDGLAARIGDIHRAFREEAQAVLASGLEDVLPPLMTAKKLVMEHQSAHQTVYGDLKSLLDTYFLWVMSGAGGILHKAVLMHSMTTELGAVYHGWYTEKYLEEWARGGVTVAESTRTWMERLLFKKQKAVAPTAAAPPGLGPDECCVAWLLAYSRRAEEALKEAEEAGELPAYSTLEMACVRGQLSKEGEEGLRRRFRTAMEKKSKMHQLVQREKQLAKQLGF